MSRTLIVVLFGFLALAGAALAQDAKDLGFEAGDLGQPPAGWFVPVAGWRADLTDEQAGAGKRSLKLHAPEGSKAPFGNVMQSLPGAEFAGRRVTLTARLMVIGEGRAQMWLRSDRAADKGAGAFDNMGDRPILAANDAGEWRDAKIEADIDPDCEKLNIGFMSLGGATAYIDDVRLAVGAGAAWQAPSPPAPPTPRGLENLAAAARLLSLVRFFHPSDQATGVESWDHVAIELMDRAEPAENASQLAERLQAAIQGLAPTVQIWAGSPEEASAPPVRPPGAAQVWSWRHSGAGSISPSNPQKIYRSAVEKHAYDVALDDPPSRCVLKALGAGVSCRLPIGVLADDDGTLPHGKTPEAWADSGTPLKLTVLNRSTRLAAVAQAWGVFQHFYPYFDVEPVDWNAVLPGALAEAAVAPDERAYADALRRMVAKLRDGHGGVWGLGESATWLPVALQWVGPELVVVGAAPAAAGISIGDVVISIDGRSAEACHQEMLPLISGATEGWIRCRSAGMIQRELMTKDPAELLVRKPDGHEINVSLPRGSAQVPSAAKRPENGAQLAEGVAYFDLCGAETAALDAQMPKLKAARAIIFDLRGYPASAAYELLEHLIDAPATSARWIIPAIRRPDLEGVRWVDSGRWQLSPKKPRLNARIAFLTDGRAISYAESIMGIVEHEKLGEIIGAATAGTNGNINPFKLPGGANVVWTGMRVLKHDGSRHHGVGIAPTVPVIPTPKGIAQGRDEVLEKAVEVMKAKLAAPEEVSK